MSNSNVEFGERLRAFRKGRSISQAELGTSIGKTGASVSDWERGRAMPSFDEMRKLADVLECDVGRLAFGSMLQSSSKLQRPTMRDAGSGDRVEEFLQEYGGESVDKGTTDSRPSVPPLILDPSWREESSRSAVTIEEVLDHLRPWLSAAQADPNIAPVMMHILKKHLPHSDLEGDHE